MTTDTLIGAILTSPCVRVTPAVLVGGVLGPGSFTSIGSPSPLRRAKTKKKKQVKEILSFFASEFSFLKNVSPEKKWIVVVITRFYLETMAWIGFGT